MKHKRSVTAGAVIAACAVAVLFAFMYTGKYLLLSSELTGKVLFSAEIREGETFSVSYIHSVNKSPVTEYYMIQNTEIYLTALRFSSFGAGMPDAPGDGLITVSDDGDMLIEALSRHVPELCYFIGRGAEHTLHLRARAVPLGTLDEPGQSVLFSVEIYPKLFILLKEISTAWYRSIMSMN